MEFHWWARVQPSLDQNQNVEAVQGQNLRSQNSYAAAHLGRRQVSFDADVDQPEAAATEAAAAAAAADVVGTAEIAFAEVKAGASFENEQTSAVDSVAKFRELGCSYLVHASFEVAADAVQCWVCRCQQSRRIDDVRWSRRDQESRFFRSAAYLEL